jgi:hypothetical protein
MGVSPARSADFYGAEGDPLDTSLSDLEHRLERLRREEDQRIVRFEEKLLDDSARRINDFERRLEHEWLALRALHEEQLKTVEQRTLDIAGNCVSVVQEALSVIRAREAEAVAAASAQAPPQETRATTIVLATALVIVILFSAYTSWRLNRDVQAVAVRAAASESQLAEMKQFVERQTRSTGDAAHRLSVEALGAASAASRLAGVLMAPDVSVYPLRGQADAPAAVGQVLLSPTRGIVVNASRLPRLPANQAYQLWMTTTRGPVSLGFIEPDPQSSVNIAFPLLAEQRGNAVGFMVTIEPIGGSERPTGAIAMMS